MINVLIFWLPSKPSTKSMKIEVKNIQICVEIDYN